MIYLRKSIPNLKHYTSKTILLRPINDSTTAYPNCGIELLR